MDGMSSSNLPERGHPDRKRALNVLAQRRYRASVPPSHGGPSLLIEECSIRQTDSRKVGCCRA